MPLDPFGWLRRKARAKGLGVHSPFAFNFIREVLFQPYGYYAYSRLDEAFERGKGLKLSREDLRRLYRILLYFSPRSIGGFYDELPIRETVEIAKEGFGENKAENVGIVTSKDAGTMCNQDVTVVLTPYGLKEILGKLRERLDEKGYGMIFIGKRMAVVVNDSNLPRQDYKLPI